MGRVTTPEIKLPGIISSLDLNSFRDGASTTSLGTLCQCLTTLWVKNFFLIPHLNIPSFCLKLLSLVPLLLFLIKSLSQISCRPPLGIGRLQWNLLSKLNNPNSLSISSQERHSSPLIILVVHLWTCFNGYARGPRTECSITGRVPWEQRRRGESSPLTCWPGYTQVRETPNSVTPWNPTK